jgi:hypothetical protein
MMGTREKNRPAAPVPLGYAGERQVTYGSPSVNKILSRTQPEPPKPVSILKNDKNASNTAPSVGSTTSSGSSTGIGGFYLGGDSLSSRRLARGLTLSAENLRQQRKKSKEEPAPGIDVLRRCKFIFVRCVPPDRKFLTGSIKSYEMMDSDGKKLFYTKEMEGMGMGKRNSLGELTSKIFCLLSLDGTELFRMEGGIFSRGKKMGEFLSCFRGSIFVGDIIEKVHRCPNRSYLVITDEKHKRVAQIEKDVLREDRCCLMRIFSSSKGSGLSSKNKSSSEDLATFKILLPETLNKIGCMGKISKFYTDLPRSLDDCFGVELPDALGNHDRTLLVASIFILYRPVTCE